MPTALITATTRASLETAIRVLRDLGSYSDWLSQSPSYHGTSVDGAWPRGRLACVGDTYADHTPLGTVYGTVTCLEPGRRITFRQATKNGSLRIDIEYTITRTSSGAEICRSGTIITTGWLTMIRPVVTRLTHRENERTMRQLVISLDALAHAKEDRHV